MKIKTNDISISVTPMKKYAAPKYPTRTESNRTPELLRKMPTRWEKNAKVVAAVGLLGAMTLTSASCGVTPKDSAFESQDMTCEETCGTDETTEEMLMLVGEPTVPIFTTEQEVSDETSEIIDMLTTEDIIDTFTTEEPEEIYAMIPGADLIFITTEQEAEDETTEELFISEGDIASAVFTTEQNYDKPEETTIEQNEQNFLNSASMPKFNPGTSGPPAFLSEEAALAIIKNIAETNGLKLDAPPPDTVSVNGTGLYDAEKQVAVMYDPFYALGETYVTSDGIAVAQFYDPNTISYENEQELEKNLREQVRDFIEWLQGQGII